MFGEWVWQYMLISTFVDTDFTNDGAYVWQYMLISTFVDGFSFGDFFGSLTVYVNFYFRRFYYATMRTLCLTVYVNFYFRRFRLIRSFLRRLTVYVNFYFRRSYTAINHIIVWQYMLISTFVDIRLPSYMSRLTVYVNFYFRRWP